MRSIDVKWESFYINHVRTIPFAKFSAYVQGGTKVKICIILL